jgi:hypothetical protein
MTMNRFARWLMTVSPALLISLSATAAEPAMQGPMRDPWVPPAVREAAAASAAHAPTRGAALHAQVESKLRASFDAADADHDGQLTLAEARAAKLGAVSDHFDRIDTRHSGRVSFEDVKAYLRGRGASTL